LTSEEFATLYSANTPGFFVRLHDRSKSWPAFIGRQQCKSALRSTYQKLQSNPDMNTENDLWNATTQMLQGKLTPQQAGDKIQADLDTWWKPVKK
jgi:raffinose/stachyose/melibiose transport system substrate-binding protein